LRSSAGSSRAADPRSSPNGANEIETNQDNEACGGRSAGDVGHRRRPKTSEMRPGMTAIIVEADEKSTRPVDDIVALGGGHVYRQAA
jgi:hypothetical protein